MKDYKKSGDILNLIAPAGGVLSGKGYVLGSLFVVAQADAAADEIFAGVRVGEFVLPKLLANVMAVGAKVNFNNTTKEVQNATSDLDGMAIVTEAAGSSDAEVKVVLIQA